VRQWATRIVGLGIHWSRSGLGTVRNHPRVLRHLTAPVLPSAAEAIGVARLLPDLAGAALTFDDGPHPEGTPAVLEILAGAGARATFFLVGEQVTRRPALAAEIVARGHAVGVHGFAHRLQLRMSSAEVAADIERAAAAIREATGVEPRWHRPPYGVYSPAGLRVARGAGLTPLLWSRWGKDWRKFTSPARIAARATRAVSAGDVILLHDADFYSSRHSHQRTAKALPEILAELRRRKLDTVLPV
jgi:peptidoglycan-N-acetylglucosamine deacetylase